MPINLQRCLLAWRKANKAGVVPFLLKGVADGSDPTRLFQADRIHPRAEAHPQMLANVWPELKKLLALIRMRTCSIGGNAWTVYALAGPAGIAVRGGHRHRA